MRDEPAVDDVAVTGHDNGVVCDRVEHRRVARRPVEDVGVEPDRRRRALLDEVAGEHDPPSVGEHDEVAGGVRGAEVTERNRAIAEVDRGIDVDEMVGRHDLHRVELRLPLRPLVGAARILSRPQRSSSSRITRWPQISTPAAATALHRCVSERVVEVPMRIDDPADRARPEDAQLVDELRDLSPWQRVSNSRSASAPRTTPTFRS